MRKFKVELNDSDNINGWYDFITPSQTLSRQFRVTFNTTMNFTEHLAFMDLGIFNLSAKTQIRTKMKVRLSAGYEDEFDAIFEGRITSVVKEREGPNIITRLLCMGHAPTDRHKVSRSYGPNVSIVTILRDIAKDWGLALRFDPNQFNEKDVFIRGYTLNGDIPACLNKLADQFNFKWSESNNFLQIYRPDVPRNVTPREISLKTGLIGVPEMSSDNTGFGVDLTVRLSPKIRIFDRISLSNKYTSYNTGNMYVKEVSNEGKVSGLYYVATISHEGDSWGNRWQTEIRAIAEKVK